MGAAKLISFRRRCRLAGSTIRRKWPSHAGRSVLSSRALIARRPVLVERAGPPNRSELSLGNRRHPALRTPLGAGAEVVAASWAQPGKETAATRSGTKQPRQRE